MKIQLSNADGVSTQMNALKDFISYINVFHSILKILHLFWKMAVGSEKVAIGIILGISKHPRKKSFPISWNEVFGYSLF
jgi:hypothetical protein